MQAVPSIAVLPFRNLTNDPGQDYFSDGLAEELTGLLAKVKGLHVAGHMSSLAFKGKSEDIALVESVQRGMRTPAFDQGRIVYDPQGSGLSEHGVHHFHGLVLDAYRAMVGLEPSVPLHAAGA